MYYSPLINGQNMFFDWSDTKSKIKYAKHGILFEEAQTVFLDLNALGLYDEIHSLDEERFIRIGLSSNLRILLVVYSLSREDIFRIISARKATPIERKRYEERI
jgi:uncharacterized protein